MNSRTIRSGAATPAGMLPTVLTVAALTVVALAAVALVLAACAPAERGDTAWWPAGDAPGDTPELFAPGIVSTGLHDRDVTITPGGDEIHFGLMTGGVATIRVIRRTSAGWSAPELASFARDPAYKAFEPTLSADGLRLLFLSTRPLPGEEDLPGWGNQNIFMVERESVGAPWGEPRPAPGAVNTEGAEYFPSLAADGTLYFSRENADGDPALWCAEPDGYGWGEPVQLPATVNCAPQCYNATVAADESWLILCAAGHEANLGPADYWIAFRGDDGTWLPAVNLGATVNGPDQRAGSACLSPDGAYLLFSARHADLERLFPTGRLTRDGLAAAHREPGNGSLDIFWVKADFVEALRPR